MGNLEEAERPSVASDIDNRLLWGAFGVLAGGALACAIVRSFRMATYSDEDRPPIIVRGGSLYFISGDATHPEPKYRMGRKWREDGGYRQPDHRKGKPVKSFVVVFKGGTGCQGGSTKSLTIMQGGNQFEVSIRPSQGKPAPAIHGCFHQQNAGSPTNPALIFEYGGTNEIESVTFTPLGNKDEVRCMNPTQVTIWPI